MQIVSRLSDTLRKEPQIYKFTSPLKSEYIKRKIMKFSVPVPVIPFDGSAQELGLFEEVRIHGNAIFQLNTQNKLIMKQYEDIAIKYRERFYFF